MEAALRGHSGARAPSTLCLCLLLKTLPLFTFTIYHLDFTFIIQPTGGGGQVEDSMGGGLWARPGS